MKDVAQAVCDIADGDLVKIDDARKLEHIRSIINACGSRYPRIVFFTTSYICTVCDKLLYILTLQHNSATERSESVQIDRAKL